MTDAQIDALADAKIDAQSGTPPRYALIAHNDDYTTMDFVVEVFVTVLGIDPKRAYNLMLLVHYDEKATVAVLPLEEAQSKAAQIHAMAERAGYPFLVTLEPF